MGNCARPVILKLWTLHAVNECLWAMNPASQTPSPREAFGGLCLILKSYFLDLSSAASSAQIVALHMALHVRAIRIIIYDIPARLPHGARSLAAGASTVREPDGFGFVPQQL